MGEVEGGECGRFGENDSPTGCNLLQCALILVNELLKYRDQCPSLKNIYIYTTELNLGGGELLLSLDELLTA